MVGGDLGRKETDLRHQCLNQNGVCNTVALHQNCTLADRGGGCLLPQGWEEPRKRRRKHG